MRASRGLVLCVALLALVAACSPSATDRPSGTAAADVLRLRSIEDLRTLFNQDAGATRLVLLMSPT
jgi:hypothetical protein